MDLKQLKYFACIVELESMTAAARSLFVAQPSLSQHIANLEADVGIRLLDRGARGTRPTEAGELLYRYAKAILRQVNEAKDVLKHGIHGPAARICVGLPSSTLKMVGEALVQAIRKSHEDRILLEIVEGSTSQLADNLGRQMLDVAVLADAPVGGRYDATLLLVEELLAFVSCKTPARSPMAFEDLLAKPLVLPAFPNSVRVKVEGASLERQLSYTVAVETASATLMTRLAKDDDYWTVLPWAAAQGEGDTLRAVRIRGTPLRRTLSLCVSAGADSSARNAVVVQLRQLIFDMVRTKRWKYATICS